FGHQSSLTVVNTIVVFNECGIYVHDVSTVTLRYNCVYGNADYNYSGVTDPTGTDGNISADPKLADTAYGDMHLQPDSPCKDAGDDSVVVPGWLDIDGQARIQDDHVDIGADESDGTVWPEWPYAIVRVATDGDDANDGSSWALAKRTVQAGIDAAFLLGGEVWVQAGTYNERITLRPYAYLYGGFAGMETERSSRDWIANVTIPDGQQGGSVVTVMAGHQVSRIDGFTIRKGSGILPSYPPYGARRGGGVYCYGSSTTIANNRITDNSAEFGGGICCISSFPTIANNTITANAARISGGGIYCSSGSVMITNNTIIANGADIAGGIHCEFHTFATIANTIIAFNSSGIYTGSTGTVTLRHNCVYGNAEYDGLVPDPTGSDGNISTDPLFLHPPSPGPDGQWGTADDDCGDLRLSNGSPCIDAGDNAAVPADTPDLDGDGDTTEPLPFDLLGGLRFFDDPFAIDTGLGTPPIVDMGAYEHVPMPAVLESSLPASGKSLWRNQRNIIRLTFDW
ncbi:MAG: hypothetical protein GX616_15460, partial [Planctomycetes bacterium]|nr:hypothetical protein [Planctomycetota bacterium]